MIADDELLDDLKRVAAKLDKSPTSPDYRTHGEYSKTTLEKRFGSWNKAKRAAELDVVVSMDISEEKLLRDMRRKSNSSDTISYDTFEGIEHSTATYERRFGGKWRACVRAGQDPGSPVPLSKEGYELYIQTAIDCIRPHISLYGLLRGFTGLTTSILQEFEFDWLSRIDSDIQPILVRVPSEHLPTTDCWELVLPDHFTTITGDEIPTQIKPLLQWMMQTDTLDKFITTEGTMADRMIDKAGVDATLGDLRATVATHLARRGVSKFEIEMQVGANTTNWERSVEDYFLYLYQFEDYCHPDYEPSGVYLDPDTGDAERIESEAN